MRFVLSVLSALVFLAVVGVIGVFMAVDYYGRDLPDVGQLASYQPPIMSRVYAGDGKLLAEYATQPRVFVPIWAMPKRVVDAFVSAEDKNFYQNPGIDVAGIARAMVFDLTHFGSDRRPIGASTITQQVARNFFLTNEVSVTRKIKEAILAVRMTKALSKDRILELYLNEIFLGDRSYGVAAAALNYFGESLDQLTIAQAAFLGGLPKAPSNYNPVRDHAAALARRNWVIGRMKDDGYITKAQADAALAEPLEMKPRSAADTVKADYFAEEVRRELLARYGEKQLYEGGLAVRTTLDPRIQTIATQAMRDGLEAYDRRHGWRGPVTALATMNDWRKALAAVRMPAGGGQWKLAAVLNTDATGAAIGFADGARGRIPLAELKWARTYKSADAMGPLIRKPSDVLKVGDVVLVKPLSKTAPPQAGGKPLRRPADLKARVAAAEVTPAGDLYALEQIPAVSGGLVALDPNTGRVLAMIGGFSFRMSSFNRATQAMRQPGSSFKPFVYLTAFNNGFTPASLVMDSPIVLEQGPGLPLWKPSNDQNEYYNAPTTLRVGLEQSRNVMTVRLAQAIGMDKIAQTAETFGVVDKLPHVLSMALGAGETTVMRLATAYAMLDNGGKRIEPSLIDRVQDRNGHTLYRHDDRPCPGCENVAWQPGLPTPDVPDTRQQIADPRTVYQVVALMQGVVQRGTAAALASLKRPLAGKTGTTNNADNAWFMGFSPNLVVGLYVGFDHPSTLGRHEYGATAAVPIFGQVMSEALANQPPVPFRIPPGVQMVRVNARTEEPAQPGDKVDIWEPFLPGTAPTGGPRPVLGGASADSATGVGTGGTDGTSSAPAGAAPTVAPGSGGLY